ncbi:unnamed protein product [Diamesa serratosioi]
MSTFTVPGSKTKTNTNMYNQSTDLNSTQALVDPEWETLDPTPNIYSLFQKFNVKFFHNLLGCVELEWSKRMYTCAGICYYKGNNRGMTACTIRLSEPLLKLRSRKDLVQTLLHEMIHALLFVKGIREGNGGHGPNFLKKMEEINRAAGTNISVYHTFHDEVNTYKVHWWRCEGPCKDRHPYFGIVKRTANRAPGPNDMWWSKHQQSCGGMFVKVKEPEKKTKKTTKAIKDKTSGSPPLKKPPAKKRAPAKKSPTESPSTSDIRNFFPSNKPKITPPSQSIKPPVKKAPETGNIIGFKDIGSAEKVKPVVRDIELFKGSGVSLGGGSKKSRLLDLYDQPKIPEKKPKLFTEETIVIEDYITEPINTQSIHDRIRQEFDDDDDDIILIDDEFDDELGSPPKSFIPQPSTSSSHTTCNCPVCNMSLNINEINNHLDQCLGI